MHKAGGDFGKRFEYEGALRNQWVRNLEQRVIDFAGAIKENIQIDRARAILYTCLTTKRGFNRLKLAQQIEWRQVRSSKHGAVHKCIVANIAKRRSYIQVRYFEHLDNRAQACVIAMRIMALRSPILLPNPI